MVAGRQPASGRGVSQFFGNSLGEGRDCSLIIIKVELTNLLICTLSQGREGKDVSVGELATRIRRLQPEAGYKHRRGKSHKGNRHGQGSREKESHPY